ncbi:hypothetical protein DFQ14_1277 [Halopolyspora algeriensis]|uniref:Uncharacterized protein n=1 Tax=Halopolyspora algeriensis TaxID=1500506 RepID=A0A368VAZ5_9ACTN|nr:hypothetical protein [Halopolyspora algeriensis]RCW37490.1 hypothetical protein DFQ14_1277 [Halopolyspora algeriensis]TQM42663.1 hypothetical protein FHU43_4303 [Halopolyspora algeriensis]TQM46220.1 hypothetical protein FHU43_3887 [Halopolyspora algeriensis]
MLQTPKATADVGGRSVEYTPTHREATETPAALSMSVTVPMSLEDITAALWLVIDGGMPLDELDDIEFTHRMVVETLITEGSAAVTDARHALAELKPGTARANVAVAVRAKVAELYGQAAMPAQRRNLVGVV